MLRIKRRRPVVIIMLTLALAMGGVAARPGSAEADCVEAYDEMCMWAVYNYGGDPAWCSWYYDTDTGAQCYNPCYSDATGYVSCCYGAEAAEGEGCQLIGSRMEDGDGMPYSGDCYGQCGYGCHFTCGGGGYCEQHDYAVRTYGFWSAEQFATLPSALLQWAACVTQMPILNVAATIVSKVVNVVHRIGKKLKKLFNE
jgi:hypothetical protein